MRSLMFGQEVSKYFNRRQKQTTFDAIGALRVDMD